MSRPVYKSISRVPNKPEHMSDAPLLRWLQLRPSKAVQVIPEGPPLLTRSLIAVPIVFDEPKPGGNCTP
jgi:hypothetical protein